jgi:hypothetical protein
VLENLGVDPELSAEEAKKVVRAEWGPQKLLGARGCGRLSMREIVVWAGIQDTFSVEARFILFTVTMAERYGRERTRQIFESILFGLDGPKETRVGDRKWALQTEYIPEWEELSIRSTKVLVLRYGAELSAEEVKERLRKEGVTLQQLLTIRDCGRRSAKEILLWAGLPLNGGAGLVPPKAG